MSRASAHSRVSANNIRGASTVQIASSGVEKKGFTVALCMLAAGEKLTAYLIFKEDSDHE